MTSDFAKTKCRLFSFLDRDRFMTGLEMATVFLLFFLYGCWPVPDVNEPYYVGKAIHFWNADFFVNDPFLNSPDSHWLFFATFGFFSLFFKPVTLVWIGRILIWFLTALGWRSLSISLIPRRWFSIFTAAAFLFYLENFHLAGEWVAGGVEGKGFAFPFLFWGLAALVRRRYARAFIFMGIASAFHVLVGGWGVLASLIAILFVEIRERFGKQRVDSDQGKIGWNLFWGLVAGGTISLVGLIPALSLDGGTSAEIRHQAHVIYVYERLAHHLVPSTLPWIFLVRFLLLAAIWSLFCRFSSKDVLTETPIWRRWNAFVGAALLIAGIGFFWDYGISALAKTGWIPDQRVAADFLRFYWFRLSDWAIPAGVALGGTACLVAGGGRFLADGNSTKLKRSTAVVWGLLIFVFLLFIIIKRSFLTYSVGLAKEATVNPLFPVAPRPVDGIAFLTTILLWGIIVGVIRCRPWQNVALLGLFLTIALFAPTWGVIQMTEKKTGPLVPRSNPPKASISDGWLDVCHWAKKNSPESAVFLTPRGYESWKWNAARSEVGNWKEIPQDAASIVPWFAMMEDLYTTGNKKGKDRWNQPLIGVILSKGEKRILKQAKKYGFDFIIAERPPYNLESFPEAKKRFETMLEKYEVYQNSHFIVFRLPSGSKD